MVEEAFSEGPVVSMVEAVLGVYGMSIGYSRAVYR